MGPEHRSPRNHDRRHRVLRARVFHPAVGPVGPLRAAGTGPAWGDLDPVRVAAAGVEVVGGEAALGAVHAALGELGELGGAVEEGPVAAIEVAVADQVHVGPEAVGGGGGPVLDVFLDVHGRGAGEIGRG